MSIKALRRLRRAWLPVGKKSLLIVLLVLFAFTLWTVYAFGKATKTEKPTQVQKTEQNVEPQFPKVAPPPASSEEVIIRGTSEDFKKAGKAINDESCSKCPPPSGVSPNADGDNDGWVDDWEVSYYNDRIGNQYMYYCLDRRDNIPSGYYFYAAKFVPWGGTRGWIGKCSFDSGYNIDAIQYNPATLNFAKISWSNYDPSSSNDYEYEYDVSSGKLSIYTSSHSGDGNCKKRPSTVIKWTEIYYDVPPRNIEGLKPTQITPVKECTSYVYTTTIIPANEWYYKPELADAPGGLPDFDQGQMPPAFCGPTAGADVIYWQLANNSGLPMPADMPTFINEIAAASGTIPGVGTVCDALEAGILAVAKAHGGWWFAETTLYAPDFVYIQNYTRQCHTMTLLLGFWQTPDGGTTWYRFGGHFVAVSGVDIFAPDYQVALSDPAYDNAEAGGPGVVTDPAGTWPHVGDFVYHNDPTNTSKDWYPVAWPSASPGGYLYLPTYVANWPDFQGQNAGPFPNNGTYSSAFPVAVEVEQAIDVSAGPKYMSAEVDGSQIYAIENNHGGIDALGVLFGATLVDGLYKGSFVIGTSQNDLTCDYGDYYPNRTFEPLGPPTLDSLEIKDGSMLSWWFKMLFNHSIGKIIPGIELSEYAFGTSPPYTKLGLIYKSILDFELIINYTDTSISGLQSAMLMDYDIGGNDCVVDWDQQHASMWMYDVDAPDTIFGLTELPLVKGDNPVTGWGLSNSDRIYDGEYLDSLFFWMENLGWGTDNSEIGKDKSIILVDRKWDLNPGSVKLKAWLKWGEEKKPNTIEWLHKLYEILHQLGYYRGDVDGNGKFDVADIIRMINYLFKSGPKPSEFVDQGDVNNDGNTNVTDVIYMVNNRFKGGPYPIDKVRLYENSPSIPTSYKGLTIRESLFNDPDWKTLGQ